MHAVSALPTLALPPTQPPARTHLDLGFEVGLPPPALLVPDALLNTSELRLDLGAAAGRLGVLERLAQRPLLLRQLLVVQERVLPLEAVVVVSAARQRLEAGVAWLCRHDVDALAQHGHGPLAAHLRGLVPAGALAGAGASPRGTGPGKHGRPARGAVRQQRTPFAHGEILGPALRVRLHGPGGGFDRRWNCSASGGPLCCSREPERADSRPGRWSRRPSHPLPAPACPAQAQARGSWRPRSMPAEHRTSLSDSCSLSCSSSELVTPSSGSRGLLPRGWAATSSGPESSSPLDSLAPPCHLRACTSDGILERY